VTLNTKQVKRHCHCRVRGITELCTIAMPFVVECETLFIINCLFLFAAQLLTMTTLQISAVTSLPAIMTSSTPNVRRYVLYQLNNKTVVCRLQLGAFPIMGRVDTNTVALQPIHGKITRHYSRYCAVAFCYVHKCELSYIYPGHDVKLHPHRVKLYRIGFGVDLAS